MIHYSPLPVDATLSDVESLSWMTQINVLHQYTP